MQQAKDFLEESRDLYERVGSLSNMQLKERTGFKDWSVETVVRHLHFWNRMAYWALCDESQFKDALGPVMAALTSGGSLPAAEANAVPEQGHELVAEWRELYETLADAYSSADPSQRCAWVGPSMSARSCITARQMETWAHGQEIYDLLGLRRLNTDRIRNIVILGVNTYGWTFKVRGQEPTGPMPRLELRAPSGEIWTYGDVGDLGLIRGLAEEFCQVVTQTRNIADTELHCEGDGALAWMAKAQCFAGGASEPPAPGTRFTREG